MEMSQDGDRTCGVRWGGMRMTSVPMQLSMLIFVFFPKAPYSNLSRLTVSAKFRSWFIPIEDLLCRFAEYPQNKSKFNQFSWQFWWQLNAYGYHKFEWWATLWNSFICPLLILLLDVCQFMIFWLLIMAALHSRCGHYIFVLWFLLLLLRLLLSSFFSSPNLSHRRLDVYHTSTHAVLALVRI